MTVDQQAAFDAVEKINEELFKKYDRKNEEDRYKDWLAVMPVVSITIADVYMFIGLTIPSTNTCQLPEIILYNSENDDRIYYEKSDKYESFYKFIKRKFIEVKKEIYAIKL